MPRCFAALVGVAVAVSGCGEWPRYKYVTEEKGLHPANVDPATLIAIEWDEGQESPGAENDIPTARDVRSESLAPSMGILVDATLDGTGWSNSEVAESIESVSCAGTVGIRTPQSEGDYIGDVDFLMIVGPEIDATLCAGVRVDQDDLGWDLALLEVDPCGIPIGTISDDDGDVLGTDLGGPSGGWGIVVDQDKRYAVLFAGYDPNDAANLVEYTLGVSLVGSAVDGSAGVCPVLPGES